MIVLDHRARRRAAISVGAAALAVKLFLTAGCFSSNAPPATPQDDSGQGADTTVPEAAAPDASPSTDGAVDATVDAPAEAALGAPEAAAAEAGEAAADGPAEASSPDAACSTNEAGLPLTVCSGVCVDTSSDPNNCGACDHVCTAVSPSTATCNTARCLIALSAPVLNSGDLASYVAFDSTSVYFTTTSNNTPSTLQRVPIGGGVTTTVVSGTADEFGGLAVGNGTVYWTSVGQSRLVATPIDGGAWVTLAYGQSCSSYPSTWNCPRTVALQGGVLYWSASGPYTASSPDIPGAILAEPATGTAATVLAVDQTTNGFQINKVVATSTGVLWNNPIESTIQQVGLDGGAVTPLVDGGATQVYAQDIAADVTNVYFVEGSGVYKMPRAGGPAVELANQAGSKYIAIDTTSVYWLTTFETNNVVAKVPIAGGTATTLASGLPNLWAIATDGTNVYFSSYTSGGQALVNQIPAN